MPVKIIYAHPLARRIMGEGGYQRFVNKITPTLGLTRAVNFLGDLMAIKEDWLVGFFNPSPLIPAGVEFHNWRAVFPLNLAVMRGEYYVNPYCESVDTLKTRLNKTGILALQFTWPSTRADIKAILRLVLKKDPQELRFQLFPFKDEVTVKTEPLPFEVPDVNQAYDDLMAAVDILRFQVKPDRNVDYAETMGILSDFDTTTLQLMLMFKGWLNIETSHNEVSKSLGRTLVAREDVSRRALYLVMDEVIEPEIFKNAFDILSPGMTPAESELIYNLLDDQASWICYFQHPQLVATQLALAAHRLTSPVVLKSLVCGGIDFHDRSKTERKAKNTSALTALEKIWARLTTTEVMELVDKSKVAEVKNRLKTHPLFVESKDETQ